jgi:hypothetical protein
VKKSTSPQSIAVNEGNSSNIPSAGNRSVLCKNSLTLIITGSGQVYFAGCFDVANSSSTGNSTRAFQLPQLQTQCIVRAQLGN